VAKRGIAPKPATGMALRVSAPDILTAGKPSLENLGGYLRHNDPHASASRLSRTHQHRSSPWGPSFSLGGNGDKWSLPCAIGREPLVAGETGRQPEAVMGLAGSNTTLSIPALPPAPNKVTKLDHRPRRSQTPPSFQVVWIHASGVFPGRATALHLASPNLIPHPSASCVVFPRRK
jgi:hypothetical protein